MTSTPDKLVDQKARVAQGAGQALMGRLGALIEALSIVAFTWAFGVETFGLYAVLWSALKVLTGFCELAMPVALQRFVPRENATDSARTVGVALKTGFYLGTMVALGLMIGAPILSSWVNAAGQDASHVTDVVRFYVWTLPFWVMVEVGTAAIRAKRTFGPEIRVRIFYEQFLRLVIAMSLWWAGLTTYGLFIAHIASVFLAALLTLQLLSGSFGLKAIWSARVFDSFARKRLSYGLIVMPATLIKRLFSELPVMALNALLPGADGAAAAAFYAIARKLASVLQLVRLAFDYVMAPLSAEQLGKGDAQALGQMVSFSTRLALALGLPLYGVMVFILPDIFSALNPDLHAAILATVILLSGRALEIMAGPSASLIEVQGKAWLPAFNAIVGLVVMAALLYVFAPRYGVEGAAVAAAIGLNSAAFLATVQSLFGLGHRLYGGLTVRYGLLGLAAAGVPVALFFYGLHPGSPLGLALGIPYLLVSIFLIIRYGFTPADAAALGRIGRIARGR